MYDLESRDAEIAISLYKRQKNAKKEKEVCMYVNECERVFDYVIIAIHCDPFTSTHTYTLTHTYKHSYSFTHLCAYILIHTHTHTCTRTYILIHTYTYPGARVR
jgi:hypothetical protein